MKSLQKVSITADATCNVPNEMLEQSDITVIYPSVKTKSGIFRENEEISAENVIDYIKRSKTPPIILPVTINEYREFFAKRLETANSICHFSVSQKLNPSYYNAVEAAKFFNNVQVIDSKQLSAGLTFVSLQAARLAKEGFDIPFIRRSTDEISGKIHTSFAARTSDIRFPYGKTRGIRADIIDLFRFSAIRTVNNGTVKPMHFRIGTGDYIEKYIKKELSIKNINTSLLFFSCVNPLTIDTKKISAEIAKYVHFDKIIPIKVSLITAAILGESAIGLSFMTN